MGKRDLAILQVVLTGLLAWDPSADVTGAADISHLSAADLDRGQQLLETMSETEIASALAAVEADLEATARPRRVRRAS